MKGNGHRITSLVGKCSGIESGNKNIGQVFNVFAEDYL